MMKLTKTLLTATLMGAATCIGSIIVTKGAEKISDPYWRAKKKKSFIVIKNKLFKTES